MASRSITLSSGKASRFAVPESFRPGKHLHRHYLDFCAKTSKHKRYKRQSQSIRGGRIVSQLGSYVALGANPDRFPQVCPLFSRTLCRLRRIRRFAEARNIRRYTFVECVSRMGQEEQQTFRLILAAMKLMLERSRRCALPASDGSQRHSR